jgi:hypothetical protein
MSIFEISMLEKMLNRMKLRNEQSTEKILICHPEPGPELDSGSKEFRVSEFADFIETLK